jgi:hypothetical protein
LSPSFNSYRNLPKITRYAHNHGHIHPPFRTRRAINPQKSLWAIRIWAVDFARERDIEAVCFTTFDGNLEIFIKARYSEEVAVYVLKTD